MSSRRRSSQYERQPIPRRIRRSCPVVGGAPRVRVVKPEPRAEPPRNQTKRATFDIAAPRIVLNPWGTTRDWRASRPKFVAALLIVLLGGALYAMFSLDIFFVGEPVVIGNKIVPTAEIQEASGMRGWNIFF